MFLAGLSKELYTVKLFYSCAIHDIPNLQPGIQLNEWLATCDVGLVLKACSARLDLQYRMKGSVGMPDGIECHPN